MPLVHGGSVAVDRPLSRQGVEALARTHALHPTGGERAAEEALARARRDELTRFLPAPAGIFTHIIEAMALGGFVQAAGCLRVPSLRSWLRRAGLGGVWSRTTLIERTAPLGLAGRQLSERER